MTEICKRFKEIRESKNMTITAVANAIGEKRQRLQDIEAGKQRIPEDVMVKYIKYFNVDANWLLTGEGDMKKHHEMDGVDDDRLTSAIETVDRILQETKRSMMPDKKAGLIVMVYDMFKEPNPAMRNSVVQLVRMAA